MASTPCFHCHLAVPVGAITCPHCGTTQKMNIIKRIFKGWGMLDFFLLSIALAGMLTLGYSYLFNDLLGQQETWHIEAQAFEEVAGQVKIIGIGKQMKERTYTGNVSLELRGFDNANKLIHFETMTTAVKDIGYEEAFPFTFVMQRLRGFAYFNVIAQDEL